MAEQLAEKIKLEGYQAIAQSEQGIGERGEFNAETKTSILPQKKIAVMAGLGWIGKSNLLVTEEYGSAICMCSVLTDSPLTAQKPNVLQSRCGNCSLCVNKCQMNVLHNTIWKPGMNRDEIVDVYHCNFCFLCLASCLYTVRYLRNIEQEHNANK